MSLERAVELLTRIIGDLGYPGVFALMALESACIPIPSEVTLLFAGFLVAKGTFTLPLAILSGLLGIWTGSTISYCVGRYGGRPLVLRYGRFVFLNEKRLAVTEAWFARYGGKAVVICRLISGLRAIISLPAGLVGMRYSRFLALTFLGSGSWVVAGILIGYFVGEEWQRILTMLRHAGHLALLVLVVAVAAAWLLHHRLSRLTPQKPEGSPPNPPMPQ
jgi:membrane protein DedA with SNARE-associated domain